MSIFGDEDAQDFDTRDLTYPGNVDPLPGSYMGPGFNGRIWRVVGSMYDAVEDKTTVTIEAPKVEVSVEGG